MKHAATQRSEIIVVDLDPLSHGGPITSLRTKFEVIKVTDTRFEVESPDGEYVVQIDALAAVKVLEMVELLDDDGSVVEPDDGKTHGYLEIWYCIGGIWRSTEFGFPNLKFVPQNEQGLPPLEVWNRRQAREFLLSTNVNLEE